MNADASNINPALLAGKVETVSTDSREVRAGDVFFAFSPPEFNDNCFNGDFQDSTKFVPTAFENGASFAAVRPERFAEHRAALEKFKDRLIFVKDAILALQRLAHGAYLKWNKPVVAVTGSAGKTTGKELAAHVLAAKNLHILKSDKNFNNGLGLPLTILKLLRDESFDAAVLEMGMSTPNNEIARLCRITPPDFAVELNVLPVHIEHLGSIENIARAKAELIEGMKPNGTAILNADNSFTAAMREKSRGRVLTFGIEKPADVFADKIVSENFGATAFQLNLPDDSAKVSFPINGRHNVSNALSAAAVGYCFGMSAREIAAALESFKLPPQRGEILRFKNDITVIDDSYNSNPDALLSMINTIAENGKNAKRIVVVAGEMRELGEDSANIHFETGKKIAAFPVAKLFGVEGLAEKILEGARSAGLRDTNFYENAAIASEKFADEIQPGDLILIKGSRGVRTEKIIGKLLENFEKV